MGKKPGVSTVVILATILVVAIVVVAIATEAILLYSRANNPTQTQITQTQRTITTTIYITTQTTSVTEQNIVNGRITVGNLGYEAYPFIVPSGAFNIQISGTFTASGGLQNDIEIYIFDSINFVNWKNGHSASAYYQSGRETTGIISVQLPAGGTYYLVYSNTFDIFFQKKVDTQVNLSYFTTVSYTVTLTTTYVTK